MDDRRTPETAQAILAEVTKAESFGRLPVEQLMGRA
jgi:hypothetical protein